MGNNSTSSARKLGEYIETEHVVHALAYLGVFPLARNKKSAQEQAYWRAALQWFYCGQDGTPMVRVEELHVYRSVRDSVVASSMLQNGKRVGQ